MLPFRFLGRGSSKYGDYSAFSGEFTINRLDYNIGEASIGMGDDVNIEFSVEASSEDRKGN